MYFLVYNTETARVQWMSCRCAVVEDWGRGLEMFIDPIPQCPARFPYVCLRAVEMWTLVVINDATFL